MKEIKKIGVLSLAKIQGLTMALMGLIVGGIYAMIGFIMGLSGAGSSSLSGPMGFIFGIGSLVFFPVFYGIMGFVGGAIGAFFYNIIAKWIGGIELEIK